MVLSNNKKGAVTSFPKKNGRKKTHRNVFLIQLNENEAGTQYCRLKLANRVANYPTVLFFLFLRLFLTLFLGTLSNAFSISMNATYIVLFGSFAFPASCLTVK